MRKPTKAQRAQRRINFLTIEIRRHNLNYYLLDKPAITDKEYDLLYRELTILEKEWPQFRNETSPIKGDPQ